MVAPQWRCQMLALRACFFVGEEAGTGCAGSAVCVSMRLCTRACKIAWTHLPGALRDPRLLAF